MTVPVKQFRFRGITNTALMHFILQPPPPPHPPISFVKWQLIEPEAFHTFWQTCYNHWVGLVGSFLCGEAQGNNHNCGSTLCESMVLFTQEPNSKQWRDHQMSNCPDHFWREKTCPALVWETPFPVFFVFSWSLLQGKSSLQAECGHPLHPFLVCSLQKWAALC